MSYHFQKRESLKTTLVRPESTDSVENLERDYYASKSGLPVGTLTDHKIKVLRDRLLVTETDPRAVRQLERDYFVSLGAVGDSVDNVAFDFFTRIGLPA